ncbi:MAG: hypothetical protein ACOH2H_06900 [Cypionkella sp.]
MQMPSVNASLMMTALTLAGPAGRLWSISSYPPCGLAGRRLIAMMISAVPGHSHSRALGHKTEAVGDSAGGPDCFFGSGRPKGTQAALRKPTRQVRTSDCGRGPKRERDMTIKKFLMAATASAMLSGGAASADALFWSTQAKPVEETQAMPATVLAGPGQKVDYQANHGGPWLTRLMAELQASKGSVGVLGALHGDFSAIAPADLVDLSDIDLGGVSINPTFEKLAKLGPDGQPYLPWMQASYITARARRPGPICPRAPTSTR